MNHMNTDRICLGFLSRLWRTPMSLFVLLAATSLAVSAADSATGSITGSVSSKGTHNALQGALVTIASINRTDFTDSAGHFSISAVPPGAYDVVISYSGFNEARQKASITAGANSSLDVEMQSSDLITMEAFTVATQREGQALSISEQRNAHNVKTVTAFDEWGILPTQNVGELASRLPGITFTTDEDQLINNISIGGQPASYTRLNVDGMSTTGVGGDGRTATLHSFSGSNYEAIEIIAGQTPDKRADSLGGQVNLKTRSPLASSERRRMTYNTSARFFPRWSDRNFAVGQRPWRPDLSFNYSEVFDVGNGRRNLGVSVGIGYQEVLNGHDWDSILYENTTNPLAQIRDYSRWSGLNDRFLSAFSARADYRVSPATTVSLRFIYNAGSEPFFNYTQVNPFINTNVTVNDGTPATATGGIKAGYTANRIEMLPIASTTLQPGSVVVGASQMKLSMRRFSFTSKNPTGTLAFEHNWGRLKVDHAYRFSNTHWDSNAGREHEDGQIDVRTKDAIGFILDNSDLRGKTFTWTGGASPYLAASYTPFVIAAANTTTQPVAQTSTVLTKRENITDTNEAAATINVSYLLPTEIPITIKAGLDTVNRRHNTRAVSPRRWYQVVGTVLPTTGLMPLTEFERQNGGPRLPVFDPAAISATLGNTALWYEDVNFTATSAYANRRIMEEGVDAAYVQGTTKLGKLTILGGVRGEWVTTDTFIYFPRVTRTLISVEPDHFKRAALDYVKLSRDGVPYHNFFPSLHLSYDVTSNFKARASWSNSYGRPGIANLVSTPTVNDTARTVTVGNPGLKPQIADNIDFKLEYYFGSTGMVSVRGYRKNITDYIGSASRSGELVPDGLANGFDGLYGGYEIIQSANIGDAHLKGLEFDFRQRLTFLPGALKGLTLRGNYTYLQTSGRFAGTVDLRNGQVPGFIPRAFNAGLAYTYRSFGASFDMNYTGRYPIGYSLTSPGNGNIYRDGWKVMNVGVTYKIHRSATLFLNVNNFAQEGSRQYTYLESRPRVQYVVPRAIKFGVDGKF
ncbi:MAG: TonB-dependent receptor [Opitutus sp.]|nr:TonB-dependent receptor [Opitutus sp.]